MANRPKPTALKIAQGNPGKRKLNDLEPTPGIVDPVIPHYLSKPGRKWWAQLAPMLMRLKVLTEADHLALALLCEQAAQVDEASAIVHKSGLLIEKKILDRTGKHLMSVPALNPAFRVQIECMKQLKSFLLEFGITPASRSKVTKMVQPEQLKRDPLGELRARAKRSR